MRTSLLEFGGREGRALHAQARRGSASSPMKCAGFLEGGEVEDLRLDLDVAHATARAGCASPVHRLLVDQLREHLAVDAELLQHLIGDIAALAAGTSACG